MDFLSNLYNNIKSGLTSAYNTVSDTISNLADNAQARTAGLINAFSGPEDTPKKDPGSLQSIDYTKEVGFSSPEGLYVVGKGIVDPQGKYDPIATSVYNANQNSTYLTNKSNNVQKVSAADQAKINSNALGTIQGIKNYQAESGIRPSTAQSTYNPQWKPVVDQYGRTSTASQGVQYVDIYGNLITPATGFSGVGGQSSSSVFGNILNNSNPGNGGLYQFGSGQAPSGLSGGSAFTGLLGSVGSGGSAIPYTNPDNPNDPNNTKNGKKTSVQTSPQSTTPPSLYNSSGQTVASINQPTLPSFNVASGSGTQNLGTLTSMASKAQETLSKLSPNAQAPQDLVDTFNKLSYEFAKTKAQLDQQQPTPPNPIQNTKDQVDFLNQSEDPYGVQQAMDEYKLQNTNLSNLTTSRIDVTKQVQALNQTYKAVADDVKNNPNLPKGLALKRIEAITKSQKDTLQGFLDQLAIINQQIEDQNAIVNRQFGIVQNAQSQAEKAQDNARQNLQLFASTGAIGGFSDSDIRKYSQLTGVSVDTLQKMKKVALEPKKDIITETDNNGNVRGIDKNTGKVAWTVSGAGKASESTSANKVKDPTQAELLNAGYAQRTKDADTIISSLGSQFTGVSSYLGQILPNALKSDDRQKYEQAERNFINAILRRESGAAISASEFDNARQQYFPQPGDNAGVVQQKAQNRQTIINSLIAAAGGQQNLPQGYKSIDLSSLNFKF